MSVRHAGRHRGLGEHGRHRDRLVRAAEERLEGRHRSVPVQPAAIRPLLTASGTLAAAALTAIVLSAPPGPLGALLGEREEDPRPTAASPRGSAPSAADIAALARDYSPGAGGWGTSWEFSVWDVLYQQNPGGPGSVLAMLCEEGAGARTTHVGTGPRAGGATTWAGAGTQPAPIGTPSTSPASTSVVLGNGGTSSALAPREASVAGPDREAAPPPRGAGRAADDDAPDEQVSTATGPAPTVTEQVTAPVAAAVKPVQPAEPVAVVEPVRAPAPVERAVEKAPEVAAPRVEAPRVEAPEVEAPRVEAPEVEAPEVEAPKVEAPRVEAPKVPEPTVQAPEVEAPPLPVDAPSDDLPDLSVDPLG